MSEHDDDREEEGSAEEPEALSFQHDLPAGGLDRQGSEWGRSIADIERVPFGGQGWWENIGPAPLHVLGDQIFQGIGPNSGQVVDIAIDPSGDRRRLYIATNSGGVWKSGDGGQTWHALTDLLPSMQIGAVAIDPGDPDIVYAGTGNLFEGGGGIRKARGLFRSLDGGDTWAPAYGDDDARAFLSAGINRIVCPAPNTLLVATESGLYLSVDGGRNFGGNPPAFDDGASLMLFEPADTTGVSTSQQFISALQVDPAATSVLRVEDASADSPINVRCTAHGFQNSDRVFVGGVAPNRLANGSWLVDVVDADHFTLRGSSGAGGGAASGWAIGPARPRTLAMTGATNPAGALPIVVTSANHELVSGDVVAVHGVNGNRGANGVWSIRVVDDDRFELDASRGTGAYAAGSGTIDAAPRRISFSINAAANTTTAIEITAPGHTLREGDTVRVTGLPGINGADRQRRVRLVAGQPDHVRLPGTRMNAAYGGAGGRVEAASVWNHALYAVQAGGGDPLGGLNRLALTSDGPVRSRDLLRGAPGVPASYGNVAVAQSMLTRATAPMPDGRVLFAAVQSGSGSSARLRTLLVSSDHGRSWTSRLANLQPRLVGNEANQTNYDLTVGVDPVDPTRLYIALKQLFTSADSGQTWPAVTPITGGGVDFNSVGNFSPAASFCLLHWDHHELTFAPPTHWNWAAGQPTAPAAAYVGTDGGIVRSDDGGASYVSLNVGIETNLFVGFDMGQGADVGVSFGGMQDTGTAGKRAIDAARNWSAGTDGDGSHTAVDPANGNIVYGLANGDLILSRDGGVNWVSQGQNAVVPILGIENMNPASARITCLRHPFVTGDRVTISGATGAGGLANGSYTITVDNDHQFRLNGFHPAALPALESGPQASGPRYPRTLRIAGASLQAPIRITTDGPHGFATGDQVNVAGVLGNTAANNDAARPSWTITVVDATAFTLDGSDGTDPALTPMPNTGLVRGPRTVQAVPIVFTTHPSAAQVAASGHGLVVTAPDHCFATGDAVDIANVPGNTASNGAGRTIRVIDRNSFELVGVAGNNPWRNGPRATGPTFGRGLPATHDRFVRIALVPNAPAPATRIYASDGRRLFRSDDAGFNFTQVAGTSQFPSEITCIVSPAANRLWVGVRARTSGGAQRSGEVRFSTDGGATWAASPALDTTPGGRTSIAAIAEDPAVANGNRVAIVYSGYSATDPLFRTRHVYLTDDRGANWREIGGTRLAATGNVPDLPVLSAAFDRSTAPSTLYVATDAGVLRWLEASNRWERVGANLPNVSCQRVVLAPTAAPASTIRIGTYGRSAFELKRSADAKLIVRGNLGFSSTVLGRDRRRQVVLHNAGGATLSVMHLDVALAGGDFRLDAPPATPFDLAAGEQRVLDVVFTPSVAGRRGGEMQIDSSAGSQTLRCSGDGVTGAGPIRVGITQTLPFGITPPTLSLDLDARIENVGFVPAEIGSIAIVAGGNPGFTLATPPATPFTLQPGDVRIVTARFSPTAATAGAVNATLQIGVQPVGGPQRFTRDCTLSGTATNNALDLLSIMLHALGLAAEPSLAD
ncbi:hypothetical protein [Burkholderia sp. GbtcB21]|uniref:hypothetical protein n=1 Tax=Burkholderia sp. GbtcB21 TaxID=2824766 RepID=UPI001C30323A|nr:hypothetical protein [Burkholderia sp. GbtcB21]